MSKLQHGNSSFHIKSTTFSVLSIFFATCIFQLTGILNVIVLSNQTDVTDTIIDIRGKVKNESLHDNKKDFRKNDYINNYKVQGINIGKYIGQGMVSVVFEAILDPPPPKEYIVKLTGNNDKNGKKVMDFEEVTPAVHKITSMLSPHPSIPQTIFFENNVPNPFHTKMFSLPNSTQLQWRLWNSTRMAISVTERMRPTHQHYTGMPLLRIPHEKVPCFWKRLFEIFNYIHSRRVRYGDATLQNFLLQNGEIMLIDWHYARIMEEPMEKENSTLLLNNNETAALPYPHVRLEANEQVHTLDMQTIAKRMRDYLQNIPEDLRSNRNVKKLLNLQKKMSKDGAPNMGWFLENHNYFLQLQNQSCDLVW